MTTDESKARQVAQHEAAIDELEALLGDRLSTAKATCEQHGTDESYHETRAPDAVAFVRSTEEVSQVAAICCRHRCPMVPFGAGTSLEGHVAALEGGVSIDLSGMDQVLEVHAEDLDCVVEPGVTRQRLDQVLESSGLFFPVDPGAEATLGGMAATRASGTTAVRYGTMRENVLALTVVLADGRVIHTGGAARKSSAGYDLTRLFVGSEGTLGVITELRLRAYGLPEAIAAAVCPFGDLDGAVKTAIETIQSGIPVARMELLDEVMIGAVNRYSQRQDPESPTLFFEFHGTDQSVKEQAEMVEEIVTAHGGGPFRWTSDQAQRAALWHARHHAYWAALALRPRAKGWSTDVCVPISRLAECILETRRDIEASGLLAPIVGHVGDGNFHLLFIIDPTAPRELAQARDINERMVTRAQAMGGTCTGEHGVGHGKIESVEKEVGQAADVMRQIKSALDPHGLMNPGKVVRPSTVEGA